MNLSKWLARGTKVSIGGKDFVLMPLPLKKLYDVWEWLEQSCRETIEDALEEMKTSTTPPNPLELIGRVLRKVDMVDVIYMLLTMSKNPETKQPINDVTKEFLGEYLDVPAAKDLAVKFVEVNQLEDIVKNLQRLPIAQKVTELLQTTLGLPFLSSLQPSTDSRQEESEGTQSHKSSAISKPDTKEGLEESPLQEEKQKETNKPLVM